MELIEQVKVDNIDGVRQLLQAGSDVNEQDEHGWTSLNWAAGRGNLPIIQLLVDGGADVLKTGRDQRTPFMIALAAQRKDVARFLLEKESQLGVSTSDRLQRQYCKAFYLKDVQKFDGWPEPPNKEHDTAPSNGEPKSHDGQSEDALVFLHQDYTVTQGMWHNENVVFGDVTNEWKKFCAEILNFKVPNELDD